MKIEVLFPEMCNLFGDLKGIDYLALCVPEAEIVRTAYTAEPLFASESPSLIYMAPMTEKTQEKVIQKLLPYRGRLAELIDAGTPFLCTGNAMEVFGESIENEDGSCIPALGLLPIRAKRQMMKRHNSLFRGEFEGETIVGFKSQFTMAYTASSDFPFLRVKKGVGLNKRMKTEGIRKNSFFGTYLLGPLLILNPPFTKKLLRLMGVENPSLAHEAAVTDAYHALLADFEQNG